MDDIEDDGFRTVTFKRDIVDDLRRCGEGSPYVLDCVERAAVEIERLRPMERTAFQAQEMAKEIAARVAEAERDAARYRWLRDEVTWPWEVRASSGKSFDLAVDSACATSDYCQVHDEITRLRIQLGETNEALAACQSEGGAWKHRAEMAELLLSDTGQRRIYWAALAVANAIRLGIGGMIRGTGAEQDLRDALWLREGEIRDVPKGATHGENQC